MIQIMVYWYRDNSDSVVDWNLSEKFSEILCFDVNCV